MLFSIIIGIAGVVVFALRLLIIKLGFLLHGGSGGKSSGKMPICIFSEGKRYWTYFRPICDEFEKRKIEVHYLTASEDDPVFAADYVFVKPRFIGEGNRALAKMNILNADIVLATTPGLNVYQWKRSKTVSWYVHIPHMAADIDSYRMFGLVYYDAVLLSGQHQADRIRKLEKLRGTAEKELVFAGIPYMDKMKERLDQSGVRKQPNKEPVVLLAPTWGKSGILSVYGDSIIEYLLRTPYKIIIRPHPQSFVSEKELMDHLMEKFPETDRLSWNRDADNFDVLNEADILISEFSGVLFDFSLVYDKPVIYTEPENFDSSPYDNAWLDEELWSFSVLPRIGRKLTRENLESIGALIEDCLNDTNSANDAQERDRVRQETWCNIGHGAEKVVDYIEKKHQELTKEDKSVDKMNEKEGKDKENGT
ncbi:MAG: CDP-glycerol glycerophosphotransferase family protein [Clostridiales bacterium]|nr:CDP-glycerol glycerophosphotransferase family protein [Clostridiales bacterium]